MSPNSLHVTGLTSMQYSHSQAPVQVKIQLDISSFANLHHPRICWSRFRSSIPLRLLLLDQYHSSFFPAMVDARMEKHKAFRFSHQLWHIQDRCTYKSNNYAYVITSGWRADVVLGMQSTEYRALIGLAWITVCKHPCDQLHHHTFIICRIKKEDWTFIFFSLSSFLSFLMKVSEWLYVAPLSARLFLRYTALSQFASAAHWRASFACTFSLLG